MSSTIQREFPLLKGKNIDALPEDLFIPPNALELILEEFSGPMDLLLYLINKKDIVLLISNSGETDEIINILSSLKRHAKEIASLTSNNKSSIAKSAAVSYTHLTLPTILLV